MSLLLLLLSFIDTTSFKPEQTLTHQIYIVFSDTVVVPLLQVGTQALSGKGVSSQAGTGNQALELCPLGTQCLHIQGNRVSPGPFRCEQVPLDPHREEITLQ